MTEENLIKPIIAGIVAGVALILIFVFGDTLTFYLLDLQGKIHAQHLQPIIDENVTIASGRVLELQFAVPEDVTNAQLSGEFVVNDNNQRITVKILSDKAHANWRNGDDVTANYDSGNVASKTISAQLPAGEPFYIILDNSHSNAPSTNVKILAELWYFK